MIGRLRRPTVRVAGAVLVGLLPWTVVVGRESVDAVFLWGLFTTSPPRFVDLYSYLFVFTRGGIPQRLLAWPVGTVLYCVGLGSLLLGFLGHEDRRVTAGLFFLSGITHLQVTFGLRRLGESAFPVGAVLSFGLAWWAFTGIEGPVVGR